MTVTITRKVTSEQLANLFISAIESGDPVTTAARGGWCAGIYWQDLNLPDDKIPANTTEPGLHWYADPRLYERDDFNLAIHEVEDEARWDGRPDEKKGIVKVHKIGLPEIHAGLQKLASGAYSHHFDDIANDNGDAATADIFLQFVVFGKEVYA